jgi:hypothetical protein
MNRYKDQRLKASSVKLVNSASVIVAADQTQQTSVASSNAIVVVCFGGRSSVRCGAEASGNGDEGEGFL